MKQLILLFLTLTLVFTSDAQSQREFEADAFSAINVTNSMEVHLEASDEHSVTVKCPSNLMDKIRVDVKNGTLMLSVDGDKWYKGWNDAASKIEVYVTCPELDHISVNGASKLVAHNTFELDDLDLEVSGASSVQLSATCDELKVRSNGASSLHLDIAADKIALKLSGASQLNIDGEADDIVITSSGASNVQAGGLQAEEAVVASSGACNIDLWVTGDLTVAASGGSNISYKCDGCDDVTVKTTGGSSVKKY